MIQEKSIKMKFPYFFQQIIGFLTVITILMIVSVISLVHFGRNTAIQETENRLFGYAESIVEDNLALEQLETIQNVLLKQGVSFFVFNEEGNLRYPQLPPDMEA